MPKFFRHHYYYPEPERLTPAEARARRLEGLLERERRFADLPNFPEKLAEARSRVVKKEPLGLTREIVNEPVSRVQKAASIAAALSRFKESDFADPEKRTRYRKLRAAQGGQQKVEPSGSDKRRFNPTGKDFASTIYGTAARLSGRLRDSADTSSSWVQVFANPGSVIPCIQRKARREVMFALGFGGRGYKKPKRRTWSSGVPC